MIFPTSEKPVKQMDRFDSIVHEYLRANRKTVDFFSKKVGCNPSSLWRYRNRLDAFQKMPLAVFFNCMRIINVPNSDLRYILGLPTGERNEK